MTTHLLRALTIAALACGMLLVPATASAAPASNDNFVNAAVVDPASLPFTDTVTVDEATMESGESVPCGAGTSNAQTVWYAITPTSSGVLRMADNASFYYQFIAAYRQDGSGLSGLTNIGCTSWAYGQNSTAVKSG